MLGRRRRRRRTQARGDFGDTGTATGNRQEAPGCPSPKFSEQAPSRQGLAAGLPILESLVKVAGTGETRSEAARAPLVALQLECHPRSAVPPAVP